jgi:D-alanyl-D-alanine carboxypeptidase
MPETSRHVRDHAPCRVRRFPGFWIGVADEDLKTDGASAGWRFAATARDRMGGMRTDVLSHALAFIRSWLGVRYDSVDVPGFVVAVAHRGRILMNEAYGYADVERRIPLTVDHIFRIASHSKSFTATAVMLLVEEGRLRLDEAVVTYLPWLSTHRDRRWSEVTIRQLLAHGAGVIRDGPDSNYWQLARPFPDRDRFRRDLMETNLVLNPNLRMKYSNYGYTLLGLVVESVTGQPYNDLVTERVIQPLGLRDTYPDCLPDRGGPPAARLATGYSRRQLGRRLPIAPVDTDAMSPATGFCATAADLATYFTAHMVGSGELLTDASKKEMQRVQWHARVPGETSQQDYGLGLILDEMGSRRLFGHSGGFPGYITKTMADPEDGLVVVALTNCIDGPATAVVKGIYKILDYFEAHTPSAPPVFDFTPLEGVYDNLWGTTQVVAMGDKLVAVSPDGWEPFSAVDTLAYVEGRTFRIAETDSYGAEGEQVHFHGDNGQGQVERVDWAGSTMWPHDAWLARIRQQPLLGSRWPSRDTK